ncbi:MAG: M20/M25/M40 family metallo-hydrolase [Vicinamibacterales bacterium]
MKPRHLLIAVLALTLQSPATEGKRWWGHIEYLASDALEGRNVGSPGFEKAATYVESQFKEIGLRPGDASGYRQPVKMESRILVPDETKLAIVRDGEEEPLMPREDATLSARGELNGSIDAPMVFVGYGISIPEANWDDLAGIDLHGKIAVYINTAPPAGVSDNVKSHVSSAGERWAVLKKAGAIGIATLPNPRPPAGTAGAATPSSATAPAPPARGRGGPATPQPTVVLAEPDLQDAAGETVSLAITRRGAEKFFAGSGHTIDEIDQLVLDKKPLPRFPLTGTLRAHTVLQTTPIDSENIVGIYEGSDPQLKNEYVVMSAHLDHLGVGRPVNGDAIYNGAMDDASGVASVIEIARLLKESGAKPKRSILFIAVTGEEKGELGSKYFAAHPTVPFDAIVADINLDMFLPLYPLKVIEVQGLTESTLGDSVREAAKTQGVDVQTDREPEQNRFIRSDQYSFIRRGIPSLAFKFGYEFGSPEETIRRTWVRDVYHKPNDDLKQPVDVAAAATFDRVIMALLQRVADDPARPHWNETSFFKRFARGSGR